MFPSISKYHSYVLLSSSSIHYRHNGGDARKAHVKHPVPSITATMEGIKTHVKHPVPSITATMEEMPERHTLAGQIIVSLDILCDRPYMSCYHPVPFITATMEEMPERHR